MRALVHCPTHWDQTHRPQLPSRDLNTDSVDTRCLHLHVKIWDKLHWESNFKFFVTFDKLYNMQNVTWHFREISKVASRRWWRNHNNVNGSEEYAGSVWSCSWQREGSCITAEHLWVPRPVCGHLSVPLHSTSVRTSVHPTQPHLCAPQHSNTALLRAVAA